MHPRQTIAALLPALFLAACQAPSLQPLSLPSDAPAPPALAAAFPGKWATAKHTHTLSIKPAANQTYEITLLIQPTTSPWKYTAHLVTLNGTLYADLLLQSTPEHFDGCIGCIPAHSIWKPNLAGDTMNPAYLDSAWLTKHLAAHPNAIPHTLAALEDEKLAILTAPTSTLRTFVASVAADKDAFPTWETLHRCNHQ